MMPGAPIEPAESMRRLRTIEPNSTARVVDHYCRNHHELLIVRRLILLYQIIGFSMVDTRSLDVGSWPGAPTRYLNPAKFETLLIEARV